MPRQADAQAQPVVPSRGHVVQQACQRFSPALPCSRFSNEKASKQATQRRKGEARRKENPRYPGTLPLRLQTDGCDQVFRAVNCAYID
jgi:hypothetical protein